MVELEGGKSNEDKDSRLEKASGRHKREETLKGLKVCGIGIQVCAC